MEAILNEIRANHSTIMNTYIMIIGIVTSFLTASVKKKVQIIGTTILAIVYVVLTWVIYQDSTLTKYTLLLAAIWVAICFFLVWNREIVSRGKLDRMIRNFTAKTDYTAPLCIFGGDLDFFGNVCKPTTTGKNKIKYQRNSIQRNKQFLQLKKMKFRNIQILSLRPMDNETRLRIGFLKAEFGDWLTIKFIEEKECSTCAERSTCLACNVCNNCPEKKSCKRMNVQKCDKLESEYRYRCYNPDTKLRGRIASLKDTGSTSVAIVTTQTSGKSYYLKEYSSNTKECTIYQNIWNVWWKKCKADSALITECLNDYTKFIG